MEILKWDYKVDGYHPHEKGLRNKLAKLGFDKVLLREIKPGQENNTKNVTKENQAFAFLAGRLFMQIAQQTMAFHQGDIIIIPPETECRFKASGNVPTKVLLARKGGSQAADPTQA